ncbi:MAG: lysylphosphatidylglycerol synthase transmembrane domain-containing protein [Bryobacteraceae bacterium]|nr:lysylphosphatidylglycerol synthase transmembrane domain-containing protein [Bryobacteraceae bacterium]
MPASESSSRGRRIPAWVGPVIIYILSAACLVWVYKDFDWNAELPRLLAIEWQWVALAVVCDILVYVCQAWRWNVLLEPIARLPLWRTVRAIYIGLFANEALPLRSGEAIRVFLQAYWSNLSFPVVLSSAILERLIDGVWLILGFFIVSLTVTLPETLEVGAMILGAIVVALSILLGFAMVHKHHARQAVSGSRWAHVLHLLIDGLHDMGRSRSFLVGAGASIVYLSLQVVPIYAMMRGYGVDTATIADAAMVLVVLRFGTVVPGPPGNVGVFNAFALMGLTLVGVDKQTAIGLSGVMFFVITVPLLLAGTVALLLTGIDLAEVRRHANRHMEQHQNTTPSPSASN